MVTFLFLILFPEIKNITNRRSNIVLKSGLLGPKRSYKRPAAIAPRNVPRLCKPCRFPNTAPCPIEFSRREISALKLGVTSPVPIASIPTPVNTRGMELFLCSIAADKGTTRCKRLWSVKKKHPVITNPIPVNVNFHSPNLLTNGPISPP